MTTPFATNLTFEAPQAVPPSSGLLSLAREGDTSDPHWEGGYNYVAELPVRIARNLSTTNFGASGANIGSGESRQIVRVKPVRLHIEDSASTMQNVEDQQARLERIMIALSSHLLERELWTGEISAIDGSDNPRLATPDAEIVTGGTSVQKAIARVVGAFAALGMGDAMVHLPKSLGIMVPDAWRNADTLQEHGFVVVSGSGYPGTGPDGTGTDWIYCTEMVTTRLSESIDTSQMDGGVANINRADNSIRYQAERIGAADFAGPVFACQVSET